MFMNNQSEYEPRSEPKLIDPDAYMHQYIFINVEVKVPSGPDF